jgi:hypothetical protein
VIYRDQLEAVYRLIEKPENWTQKAYARDEKGEGIDDEYDIDCGESLSEIEQAAHPAARCWCLFGAAYKCGVTHDIELGAALGFKIPYLLSEFNDTHTHAEVLALLKSAIDRAPVRP